MSRANNKISRDKSFSTYSTEEPSWAKEYAEAVSKYSVKSKQEDSNLFDQINSILGNSKSKYSSVEEAVLDMQKRTGLYDLMQKKASEEGPELFKELRSLKYFIDNHTATFKGNSVEAVILNILKIPDFKNAIPNGEDIPQDVKDYINSKIAEANPVKRDDGDAQLGKTDVSIDNETISANNPMNMLNPKSV